MAWPTVIGSGVGLIFGWLRCHVVLVVVAVFAAVGYLLRDELVAALSPIDVQVTYGLEGERGPIQDLAGQAQPTQAETPFGTASDDVAEPAAQPPALEPQEQPAFVGGASEAEDVSEEPSPTKPVGYQQPIDFIKSFHFRPLDDSPVALWEGVAGGRQGELLNKARRAYWNDDLGSAASYYETLVKEFPHNPDYLGELGNVYFQQGDKQRAAKAYFNAAVRLENQGEQDRATKLGELLHKIDPGYAKALDKHFEESRKPSGTKR
jgi:TolA-binding protein